MKKVKLDKGKYYHRSLVSYMPSIVESGEIVPTAENVLQREERAWRYLNKRGFSDERVGCYFEREY